MYGELFGTPKSKTKRKKDNGKTSIDKQLDALLNRDNEEFSGLDLLINHDDGTSSKHIKDIDQEELERRRYYDEQIKKEQEQK